MSNLPTAEPKSLTEELFALEMDEARDRLKDLTDEQLVQVLSGFLHLSVHAVVCAAWAVSEMERRGINLEGRLDEKMLGHLRQIADGRMLPEVLLQGFRPGGNKLVWALGSLVRADQRRFLVEGERVPVVVTERGGRTHKMALVTELRSSQIDQVFDHGRIRNLTEQGLYLDDKGADDTKPIPERVGEVLLDHELGTATMPVKKPVPLCDLEAVVRYLRRASRR